MTIRQLKEPCFELTPNPWGPDGGNPHYATWLEADEALRELRDERGPDPRDLADLEKTQAKANPAGCWVGECDGCGDMFTDEETNANHYETAAELDVALPLGGWVYQGGDAAEFWPAPGAWTAGPGSRLLCPGCNGGARIIPPPSPAELEAAGQLRLPGVA